MKQIFNLKKSRWLLFTLLALFAGMSPAWADELTVNDGTTTNAYIPINGTWVDTEGITSEFIIPSETLEDIVGATLTKMSFYVSTAAIWEPTFKVYIKEVNQTVYAIYGGSVIGDTDATIVYEGTLTPKTAGSTMDVTFTTNYIYGGSNLLVGLKVTGTASSYASCGFYGISTSTTYRSYNSKQGPQGFLPKVTFTYTPDANFVTKPSNVTATNIAVNSATISWDAVDGADSYELSCSTSSAEPDSEGSYTSVNATSYNQTGLTSGTTYYVYVRTVKGGNKSKWSAVCSFTPGTLTINNVSTTTNSYVPIYGYDMDSYNVQCQFIIPSSSLSSLNGNQITKLEFYGTDSRNALSNNTFDVYMSEVADATISTLNDWASLDKVYSGSLSVTDSKMTITLSDAFDYSGGNLLIGFIKTGGSSWTNFTWTGISATDASLSGASSVSQRNFLPQTTFYFAPQTASVKKPKNLDDTATATTTATLGWTNGGDETAWQIAYSTDTDFNPDTEGTKVNANANPFTLTELTAGTTYYAYVRAEKSGEYSAWSNKADFTTLSAVPVIEFSTTSHNFGLVSDADAQALTLTISNTGGAPLTGLSITASTGFAITDAEGNPLTATTIAASSSLTIKVKVNALGQQTGTITIDGTEIDEQTVNVSGYMLDNTKILETFASASSVSRWTVASGWTFNASTGAYAGTSSRIMTSPKLSVSAGNVLALNVKLGWIGGSLIVEGLDAEGNTVYDPVTYNASNGGLNTSSYVLLTIDDMPTTVAKVKLTGYYAYINVFNGFSYVNDPVLGLYSNEACTSAQASPATKNFGFATEAQNQVYYIKNTGNGQIDLSIEQADGFTAAVASAALGEGESTALTVTMTATEGLHDGTITVTAKNHDDNAVLGTFVVNANGAITGTKNNVVLSAFPAGWQNNNWTINNGAARNWSSTSSDLITTTLTVTEGEKLLVEAYKYYSDEDSQLSYSYSTDGGSNWSDPVSLTSQLTTSYKIIAISGIPAGNVLMKFSGTYTYIRQIYGFEAFAEPIMEFAAEGTTKNFGMVTANTTSDAYTITNSGTAKLENLSVTCNNANFEIAVTDDADEIAANGGTATFTITLKNTVKGSQTGTVTISGDDVAEKTFTVKGYVADDTKIFTTFTALPDRWTNTGDNWSFSASGATATSSSSKLESPKITITEGQKLAISAMQRHSGSSYYVTINGSSDNGATWTAYTKTLNNAQLNNTDYTVVELDDIPTTVNKLQLVGYYVYVNGLNGFTYDDNDPEFGVFSDSEFASQITSGKATNAWGFVSEDKTATYYIKNTGTGTMTLSKSDAPAGFTAALGATSLGTGESTSLVISMENDAENNEGYHAGNVVLTAKDNADNTLGTFTVTSSGVVVGDKTDVNFTTLSDFPAGWETTTWIVTENTKATVGYSTGTLTTGTYSVAAGESMVVMAKKNASYGTLSYKVSTDGGANWSDATTITPSSTSDYELKVIEGISAGDNVKIQFTGYYADIQRIYGFTAVAKPAMTLSPAAASYDFGMQTTATDYIITVTNSGTADMENLAAALTGDDADDFEVAVSKTTVPYTGENTATITVTMKASTEYATHNATLTISADGLADKVITLSGKTRDASKWYVDFASEIPLSFVETDDWTVSSGTARTTSSTENSLTTQPINLAAGEKIYFDAYNPYSGSLKVRYSLNGGLSWSDYTDYTASINTSGSTFSSHEIDLENDDAVTAVIEFTGRYYIQLDNIYGGTLNNTASMMKVTKGTAVVGNGSTEAFGSIKAEATATYTITNPGNGTLTIISPVTVTGAATASVSATSLTNGESATLTITMPVEAPYGAKNGAVTVETSLGNFVINYTANILNPNALDEQFASGQPAGWYFGNSWSISSNEAAQESGTATDLITEQLTVANTSDVLTFQAARTSSYTAPSFKVYTSQDRVTWNEVDLSDLTLTTSYQDVNISGLSAGDYYVKITGSRVKVDNFLGWEKKNNTRDLYVTATSFPTTSQLAGAEITPSATVTSLIADETGVYAKLFIDGAEAATADAQDIALNATKTFSFNYTLPSTNGTYAAQIKVYFSDDTEAFATAISNIVVDYPSLSLYETDASLDLTAGTYNVKLDHDFVAGWNTVCLPFEAQVSQIDENAVAYAFTGFNSTTKELTFTKVTTLTAAQPYVVYTPTAFTTDLQFNGVAITDESITAGAATFNEATFQGTYVKKVAGEMTDNYGITSEGKIAKGTAQATMMGFRAYFELPAGGAARLTFVNEDGTTTSIMSTELNKQDAENIYNLQGQKVTKTSKAGLYIKNGKKVIVK